MHEITNYHYNKYIFMIPGSCKTKHLQPKLRSFQDIEVNTLSKKVIINQNLSRVLEQVSKNQN